MRSEREFIERFNEVSVEFKTESEKNRVVSVFSRYGIEEMYPDAYVCKGYIERTTRMTDMERVSCYSNRNEKMLLTTKQFLKAVKKWEGTSVFTFDWGVRPCSLASCLACQSLDFTDCFSMAGTCTESKIDIVEKRVKTLETKLDTALDLLARENADRNAFKKKIICQNCGKLLANGVDGQLKIKQPERVSVFLNGRVELGCSSCGCNLEIKM